MTTEPTRTEPASVRTETANSGRLRKNLGLTDVIAQSLAVIAPAMSGAFLTYLVATKAGGATPLSYLLGTLGALSVGLVVAQYARSMSSAGSLYTYITVGFGRTAGFVAGWAYAAAFLVLGCAVLGAFGYFTSSLVQQLTGAAQPVPWYWFFIAGLAVCALLNMFNVRMSTRSQLLFTALSMLAMVVTAVLVIGHGSPEVSVLDGRTPVADAGRSLDFAAFSPSGAGVSWTAVLFGLGFAMLSFTGSEASAVLGEETQDPQRNIPRAVIGSVLAAGVFYLVVTYATSIGFGVRQAATDWPGSVAGLAAVAGNDVLGLLVLVAAAAAALFCALGVHIAVSRVLFAMGREGVLPGAFGRLHRRFHVPWNAIFFTLGCWALLAVLALALTSERTRELVAGSDEGVNTGGVFVFSYLATIGTPLVMFVYLLLGLSGIRHGMRHRRPGLIAAGIAASLAGALAVFGGVYYSFVEAAPGAGVLFLVSLVPWICLGVVLLGALTGVLLRRSRPANWASMGTVFDEV